MPKVPVETSARNSELLQKTSWETGAISPKKVSIYRKSDFKVKQARTIGLFLVCVVIVAAIFLLSWRFSGKFFGRPGSGNLSPSPSSTAQVSQSISVDQIKESNISFGLWSTCDLQKGTVVNVSLGQYPYQAEATVEYSFNPSFTGASSGKIEVGKNDFQFTAVESSTTGSKLYVRVGYGDQSDMKWSKTAVLAISSC